LAALFLDRIAGIFGEITLQPCTLITVYGMYARQILTMALLKKKQGLACCPAENMCCQYE
jgi:hypothetical protein